MSTTENVIKLAALSQGVAMMRPETSDEYQTALAELLSACDNHASVRDRHYFNGKLGNSEWFVCLRVFRE